MIKINLTFDFFTLREPFISSIIKKCITKTLDAESVLADCEINVLVTGDQVIRGINASTRNIDQATDVLSFPMFDLKPGEFPEEYDDMLDPETGLCPLGDMVISLERAKAQAREFGHSIRREVGYLTIHSMLHLLGYDHMDEGKQKKLMRKREEEIASAIRGMQR